MKPSEVLDNAANIILRDGWHQGHYYREVDDLLDHEDLRAKDAEARRSAPCCQAGAICRAIFGTAWKEFDSSRTREETLAQSQADMFMRRYVKDTFGLNSPIEWNDQRGRTADEVIEALRAAAEMARGEGN